MLTAVFLVLKPTTKHSFHSRFREDEKSALCKIVADLLIVEHIDHTKVSN